MYKGAVKAHFDLFTLCFPSSLPITTQTSNFSPYTLPGKMTSQNVHFIYQHGVDVDPYFAGKYNKLCWKMIKNRFHYERKHTCAYIVKVWVF